MIMMEVLLEKCIDFEITEAVIAVIVGRFDWRIIELLLSKHPNIRINDAVVEAAAKILFGGNGVMEVLLEKCIDIRHHCRSI
jgi:hypothetical protein